MLLRVLERADAHGKATVWRRGPANDRLALGEAAPRLPVATVKIPSTFCGCHRLRRGQRRRHREELRAGHEQWESATRGTRAYRDIACPRARCDMPDREPVYRRRALRFVRHGRPARFRARRARTTQCAAITFTRDRARRVFPSASDHCRTAAPTPSPFPEHRHVQREQQSDVHAYWGI